MEMQYDNTTDLLSIADFCGANRISRPFLYKLWAQGKGPKFIKLGRRVLISKEAAAEWRSSLENSAA
jgi:predicted DNA-binding transcriptional regulator AlpA